MDVGNEDLKDCCSSGGTGSGFCAVNVGNDDLADSGSAGGTGGGGGVEGAQSSLTFAPPLALLNARSSDKGTCLLPRPRPDA